MKTGPGGNRVYEKRSQNIANFSPDQKITDDRVQMPCVIHLYLRIMISSPVGKNIICTITLHSLPFIEPIRIYGIVNDIFIGIKGVIYKIYHLQNWSLISSNKSHVILFKYHRIVFGISLNHLKSNHQASTVESRVSH